MTSLLEAIDKFVIEPKNRELLQILKSIRNGLVYGGRLRFAHSLVIQLLFKTKVPLRKRLRTVLEHTREHGTILASFAFLYKSLSLLLKLVHGDKHINEFISGFISGAIVYGNTNNLFNHGITHQITLYCGVRVLLALGASLSIKISKYLHEQNMVDNKKKLRLDIQKGSWTLFASLSWGMVMYLHRFYPSLLQHSLESSMEYIYDDTMWYNLRSLLGIW